MIYQKIEKLRVINSGLVSSLLKASSQAEDFATACEHLVKRYELSDRLSAMKAAEDHYAEDAIKGFEIIHQARSTPADASTEGKA